MRSVALFLLCVAICKCDQGLFSLERLREVSATIVEHQTAYGKSLDETRVRRFQKAQDLRTRLEQHCSTTAACIAEIDAEVADFAASYRGNAERFMYDSLSRAYEYKRIRLETIIDKEFRKHGLGQVIFFNVEHTCLTK